MSDVAVYCPHCGVSRYRRCTEPSGRQRGPHAVRVALAAAEPPPEHDWQGYEHRIDCAECGVPVSVDRGGYIVAHATRKGTSWCPASHLQSLTRSS